MVYFGNVKCLEEVSFKETAMEADLQDRKSLGCVGWSRMPTGSGGRRAVCLGIEADNILFCSLALRSLREGELHPQDMEADGQ